MQHAVAMPLMKQVTYVIATCKGSVFAMERANADPTFVKKQQKTCKMSTMHYFLNIYYSM